ncbi:MAG: SpoIIE family protein phosphatase [Fusobacteriota bacterium]
MLRFLKKDNKKLNKKLTKQANIMGLILSIIMYLIIITGYFIEYLRGGRPVTVSAILLISGFIIYGYTIIRLKKNINDYWVRYIITYAIYFPYLYTLHTTEAVTAYAFVFPAVTLTFMFFDKRFAEIYLLTMIPANIYFIIRMSILGLYDKNANITITVATLIGYLGSFAIINNLNNKIIFENNEMLKAEKKMKKELEIINKKIIDSINYAQNIQQNILPNRSKLERILNDFFIIWKPAHIVGGDFYWVKETENGYYIGIIDCTGHGVPGALMTMTTNSILNRIIEVSDKILPADILRELNLIFKETINSNNSDYRRDDGLEIGLCYVQNDKITYSGAGIPLYYNDEVKIIRLKADRHGIGYRHSKKNYKYTNHEIYPNENQVFYMTSDGYLDQNGGPKQKRFGRKSFINMLEENCCKDLKKQKEIFKNNLEEYMKGIDQRDDITVVGFSVK